MSILEILEAHTVKRPWSEASRMRCKCGETVTAETEGQLYTLHRAHVAQVLAQHEREREAAALEEAAGEIERLENIGDTAQGELNEEQTAEYWLYHGTPKTTWLRDLAAQIRSQS